jgi:hypothetical protein
MKRTLRRPVTVLAAIFASALSFGAALLPMTAQAASPIDTAMAACAAAWQAQAGAGTIDHVRLNGMNDSGRLTKLDLRARGAAGATLKIKCAVDASGTVVSLGGLPVTQLASGQR